MSVSVVAETLFLTCIYILYPMFYMYHVTGRNKVVYCILFSVSLQSGLGEISRIRIQVFS